MNHDQIVQQSKQAYNQWCEQWRAHARAHAKFPMKTFNELNNIGIGKAILCVGNGYSFEENIDLIREYSGNVDIICCDKSLGHLLDNGITPTYCLVCDANVSFEKYMAPWKDQLQDTILIQNVCGNPAWTDGGNWKDRFFYVNMDVMGYEKEFSELSGCKNFVTAGTNVSNMLVVMVTQSDNTTRKNFFGYDKIILIGFDYSWKPDGKYYAFDQDGGGKFYYMRHIHGLGASGAHIYASNNLSASASWLDLYIRSYKLPVVQCSPDTIAPFFGVADLEAQLRYGFRREDQRTVQKLLATKMAIESQLKSVNDKLKHISREHYFAHMATV